jgi:hypothetical protein
LLKGAELKAFLSELREIGWREWDPIGLSNERTHCEDEYDRYLLAAAGKLINGATERSVADYFVDVETRHMGIPLTKDAHQRNMIVAAQISAIVHRK